MPALVLIHGFLGAPRSFRRVVAALPPETRVGLPLLLGHTGSPYVGRAGDFAAHLGLAQPTSPTRAATDESSRTGSAAASHATELDRLLGWLARHELDRAVLVGYSLGARIALGLAAHAPQRFARAILVGVHPGLADAQERAQRVAHDERHARELEHRPLEAFVDAWERLPLFQSQRALDERDRSEQRGIRLGHAADGIARSLRCLGLGSMPDHLPALARATLPVDLVVGQQDDKFLALAQQVLIRAPRAELHVIEDAGHNVVLERPLALVELLTRRLEA